MLHPITPLRPAFEQAPADRSSNGRPASRGGPSATDRTAPDPVERIGHLLGGAARLDQQDDVAWAHLREIARRGLEELVAVGRLPAHLVIAADDPPAVVSRSLVAAWRYATDAPSRRQGGRVSS